MPEGTTPPQLRYTRDDHADDLVPPRGLAAAAFAERCLHRGRSLGCAVASAARPLRHWLQGVRTGDRDARCARCRQAGRDVGPRSAPPEPSDVPGWMLRHRSSHVDLSCGSGDSRARLQETFIKISGQLHTPTVVS